MRKLASIRTISAINPIDGADKIEVATIDGWKVVVNKGIHKVGETVVYFEIDSILPIREEFEFLRKSSYIKLSDGTEGFRLKTIRLRGQVSQGLVTPISVLPDGDWNIGDDVTDALGIIKYEPPIPAKLSGVIKGNFPSFIKKTDEERAQNFAKDWDLFRTYKYFVTEKLDGTSFTCYLRDGDFGVCTRNLEIKRDENQTHWKIAIQNNIENKLKSLGRNLAIQGEIIGEGIQKNRYGLKGHKLFVFNIFDIDKFEYLPKSESFDIANKLELENVPVISTEMELPTLEEALRLAEGKSFINHKTEREGFVWVAIDSPERISFKTISNKFLLGSGE
jgi:RNA ligase (TIGR02306 family)